MGKASRKRRERMEQVQKAREIEGLVKRARFFDTIQLAMRNPDTEDDVWWINPDTPVIDAQYAYEYESELHDFDDYSEVINHLGVSLKPPFNRIFVEWKWEHALYGVLVNLIDVTSDCDQLLEQEWKLAEKRKPETSYLLAFETTAQYLGGKFGTFPCCVAELDDEYRFVGLTATTNNPFDFVGDGDLDEGFHQRTAERPAFIALLAVALMNVRNIVTVDHEPDPADNAAYQRHFGVPMTKYKTLAIKLMSKRYERDDQPQQQFDVMPLHIRRGNFAHYTDDAPLFGKYTGTFWRPATAVGNAKNGIRVKDYEVKSG